MSILIFHLICFWNSSWLAIRSIRLWKFPITCSWKAPLFTLSWILFWSIWGRQGRFWQTRSFPKCWICIIKKSLHIVHYTHYMKDKILHLSAGFLLFQKFVEYKWVMLPPPIPVAKNKIIIQIIKRGLIYKNIDFIPCGCQQIQNLWKVFIDYKLDWTQLKELCPKSTVCIKSIELNVEV